MVPSSPADGTRGGFVTFRFVSFENERNLQRCGNVFFNILISKKQSSFDPCHAFRKLNSTLNTCVAEGCALHEQKR